MTLLTVNPHRCKLPSNRFRRQQAVTVCRECGEVYFVEGYNGDYSSKDWVSVTERQAKFKADQVEAMRKIQQQYTKDTFG